MIQNETESKMIKFERTELEVKPYLKTESNRKSINLKLMWNVLVVHFDLAMNLIEDNTVKIVFILIPNKNIR